MKGDLTNVHERNIEHAHKITDVLESWLNHISADETEDEEAMG